MEAVGSAASIIAVIELTGIVAKLCGCYILDVKDARHDIERLQKKVETLSDIVKQLAKISDQKTDGSVSLPAHVTESIGQCLKDLQKLENRLQPKTRHKAMSKVGWRALKWPLSKTDVNEQVQRLEGYVTIFNTALQLVHIAISQGLDSKLDRNRDEQLLMTISHVGEAAFNSYENQRHRQCLPNTRVELLREIMDWTTSSSSQYIFWLKGRAGTGKSTIALTIAQSLDQQEAKLASFFFKRGSGDLARSRKVVSTIAFQLAFKSSLLGGFICDALRNDPNLGKSASLSEQYHKLLLQPLQRVPQSVAGSPPFVVVLDALDECDDMDDIRLLLRLLGNTQSLSGLGLRLLVTSRPEAPIRLGFRDMKHIAYHELALHDVPRALADRDINIFVAHELAQIKADRGLPDSWPGDDRIRTITTLADGLFIYAATVCRFVNGPRQVNASVRLEQICQRRGVKHKSTDALDEMYLMVLKTSMSDDFSADEETEVAARLRHVVGSVVLLFDNLSAPELERLLFPSTFSGGDVVRDTLDSLHAILDVPKDPQKPVQMQHLSFRDFLVDHSRCDDIRFHVNQQQGHRSLLTHCMSLMAESLAQNICHLPSPSTLVSAVSEAVLHQYLPPGLIYACRYWIDHIKQGQASLDDDGPVHAFLQQCGPFWLEVMSLIRKFPQAMGAMRQLEEFISVKKSPKLYSLVSDMVRFMYSFSHILTQAPLQLYSSGVFFSPTDSSFRRMLASLINIDLVVATQLRRQWSECIQTLEGHSREVISVVFSLDGTRLASGSDDSTVRVWDVQTGECRHTLEGHSDGVSSVIFSPDGARLASGSRDSTVRRGERQHTLEGHSSWVSSVVFSPDGARLASGSRDSTVRVWDVQRGECQHTLEGHSSWVNSVAFSPDGTRLASGSNDSTVRVWDVQTGECQHTLEGHSSWVYGVIFSPDGTRLASGSSDSTVRVWDVQRGERQHTLEGHSSWVSSVVFSPDGARLASGSRDSTVRVWDVQRGECQHTLEGHSGVVSSMVFSPDGTRLASGSYDSTVRVWDVQRGECQHTLEGHSSVVSSVVFSPDGTRLASGSNDSTVRVWDVQTGKCQHTLEGHSSWVSSVVFSPDGTRLASGSNDRTVRVWDVVSGIELLRHVAGAYDSKIEFNHDSTKISVNGEAISTPLPGPSCVKLAGLSGRSPKLPTTMLGIDGDWVTWSSEKILWFPPEYRPRSRTSRGNFLVIGSGSGRVTFLSRGSSSSPLH
ncbi:uncharacterized protein Z518_03451 [Rhinocladiella mackenziei CBS 650.93]|uniref:Mitochondrial division protein 1 n=1 Tax=Rhinocladiella mackenziei CBS 650.93 TaxID=1442369 RepID=A0A0D2IS16_9EURO|nr:uncharacterized protein Z518_03451 [Rhinocladiella mackenziei CBS 650.93]KIX08794.1 hypothetical protein Z518_03451 [Rhinocladiella mackenziei CBS 650.93]